MARKTVRRITADKKEKLNKLAKILYAFLPLSSRSKSAVTFRTIFSESSIEKYLDGESNKQQALEKGLTKLFRYHQRLPYTIIRKIVPEAISYRKYIRNPLTKNEVDDLSAVLFELGVDMRDELSETEIDESLPRITVPPEDLEKHLRKHDLDSNISSEPLQLYSDGHFNEAVRKAAERLEDFVQDISNLGSSGRDLMANAFRDGTYINTTNIQPENQEGFIDGFKFLTMGTMASIRNVFSHGDEERRSPEECFEMLLFINWLFRFIKSVEEQ